MEAVKKLIELDKESRIIEDIGAILGWDQETYMPEGAVEGRADQAAFLSGLSHQHKTNPEIAELIAQANKDLSSLNDFEKSFLGIREEDYNKETRLSSQLVKDLTKATALAQNAWAKARKEDDFQSFAPYLQKVLDLTRQKAEALGYEEHPYDALLEDYEPGMRVNELKAIFGELKVGLVELLGKIRKSPQNSDDLIRLDYPVDKQDAFGRQVMADLGFDSNRGRLDLSTHPFTTQLGANDIRITTRYDKNFFNGGIFSTIHETGHALYEQGIGDNISGTTVGDGTSLGIHESQSRFWENMVGRSKAFWEAYWPQMQSLFPENMSSLSVDDLYKAFNKVESSFIRTEADEVTYSLHIILRFEIELALLEGSIKIQDLPSIWNEKMEELLGIVPSNNTEGVLQDVHWSFGLIGYFPTYSLGNLYSAQFKVAMEKELGPISGLTKDKKFNIILNWLHTNIHQWGRLKKAGELCKEVTGENLNPQYFLDYLNDKYSDIYGF